MESGYHHLKDSYLLEKFKKLLPALNCAESEGECRENDVTLAYRAFCGRAFELMTQAVENFEDMWDFQSAWLEVYESAVELAELLIVVSCELTSACTEDLVSLAETFLLAKKHSKSFRSVNACCGIFLGVHSKNVTQALTALHHHRESLNLANLCVISGSDSMSDVNVVNHVPSDEESLSEASARIECTQEEISESLPSSLQSKEVNCENNAANSGEMGVDSVRAMHTSALVFPDDELLATGSFSLTTAQEKSLADGLGEMYESSNCSNSFVIPDDESKDVFQDRFVQCDLQAVSRGGIPCLEDMRVSSATTMPFVSKELFSVLPSSKSSPMLDYVSTSQAIDIAHQIHCPDNVDFDSSPCTLTALVPNSPGQQVAEAIPAKVMEACCYIQPIFMSEIKSFIALQSIERDCKLIVMKGAAEHCLHNLIHIFLSSDEVQDKYGKYCICVNAGEVGRFKNSTHKLLDMLHTKLREFQSMDESASTLIVGWDVESLIFQSQKLLMGKEWLLIIENLSPVHLEELQPLLLQGVMIVATSSAFDGISVTNGVKIFDIDHLHSISRERSLDVVLDCCGISPGARDLGKLCTSLDIVGCECSTIRLLAILLKWNMTYGGDSIGSAIDDVSENLANDCYTSCSSASKLLQLSMLCLSVLDQERYISLSVLPSWTSISLEIFAALWGDSDLSDTKRNLESLENFYLIDRCSGDQWRMNSTQSKFTNAQAENFGHIVNKAMSRLAEYLSKNEHFMDLFTSRKHLLVRFWEGIPRENLEFCLVKEAKSCLEVDVVFVGSVIELLIGFGAYDLAEDLGTLLLDKHEGQTAQITMNLMSAVACALEAEDDLGASESIWRAIVSFYRESGEQCTLELADSLSHLCALLFQQDQLQEAENVQKEALAEWKELVSDDHPKIMQNMMVLSNIFQGCGKLDLSEVTLRSALASKQVLWGDSHSKVLDLLKALFCLLKQKSDLQGIAGLQDMLLNVMCKASGQSVINATWLVRDISVELESVGMLDAAEKGLRSLCEMFNDTDHHILGDVLGRLGSLLDRRGNFEDARAILTRTLSIKEKFLGTNHPDVAAGMSDLACVLCRGGMFAESESLHKMTLSMRQSLFGDTSAEVASSYASLGSVLEASQQFREAEVVMQQALFIWKELEGEQSVQVASTMNALGVILEGQYRFRDAEFHHRKALNIWMNLKDINEIEIASAECALANAVENLKKYKEAERLYRSALATFEQEPKANSAMIASTMNSLGLVLESQDLLEDAEGMHRGALSIWKQLRGEHHPDVITSMTNLAFAMEGRGDLVGSEALMANALSVTKAVYGPNHPEVCSAMENLLEVLDTAGKSDEANKLEVSVRLWKQKYYHNQP